MIERIKLVTKFFTHTNILCISGRAGVGKSTVAWMAKKYLESLEGITSKVLPFAQGVKDTARRLGWNSVKDGRGRKFLIDIGMAGREYNQNTWVNMVIDQIDPVVDNFILIDDWRFINEEIALRNQTAKVWRIRINSPSREGLKGTETYNDPSETGLPFEEEYYDYYIDNVGTLTDLETKTRNILDEIIDETLFERRIKL
jgi:hypothetical protein